MELYYQLAVAALLAAAGVVGLGGGVAAYYLGLAANVMLAAWLAADLSYGGLWLIVFTPLCFFSLVAPFWRAVRGLAPLFFLPLSLMAVIASLAPIFGFAAEPTAADGRMGMLVVFHIITAASAYGALAAAAAAGVSVLLRENSLRLKKPPLLPSLPSLHDGELVEVRLLSFSIAMLVIALGSGSVAVAGWSSLYAQKAAFAGAALLVASVSLGLRWLASSRGRRLARLVLLAWALLTPAWPGLRYLWQ